MFILNAHPDGLNTFCMTFLPGSVPYLATAGKEGVRIWDLARREVVQQLTTENESPSSLSCSPDGRLLVVCVDSGNSHFHVWDWAANRVEASIELFPTARLQCAVFSPSGKSLALAGVRVVPGQRRDYSLSEYSTQTWKSRRLLRGHTDQSGFLAYSPDGRHLASGAADKTSILWDLKTYQPLATFKHRTIVWEVAFSPDGSILATPDGSNIRLVNVAKHRPIRGLLRGHKKTVYGLTFTHDGKYLASVGEDGMVRLWHVGTRKLARQFDWEVDELHVVRFSHDGHLGAAGAADGRVVVWDMDN